jgi:hypothetical protein
MLLVQHTVRGAFLRFVSVLGAGASCLNNSVEKSKQFSQHGLFGIKLKKANCPFDRFLPLF